MNDPCGTSAGALARVGLVAALLTLTGCSETVTPPEPSVANIDVTPPSASAAALGATVSYLATARDGSGNTMSGVSFTWTSSAPGVAIVNASGVAEAVSPGSAAIRASAQGVTGSASLSVAQEPSAVSLVDGDAQLGLAREALAAPLRVRVLDSRSNPIPGVALTWEVLAGGGSIVGSGTDASGEADATWTLGPAEGAGAARARLSAIDVTFTSTALPNGVIQGTVTETAAQLAPPRLARSVAANPAPLSEGPPTAREETRKGMTASVAPAGLASAFPGAVTAVRAPAAAGPRSGVVPGELLVGLRTARLGMPARRWQGLRSRDEAADVARVMRAAAASWQEEGPLEIARASPVLGTVRIRVPPDRTEAVRQRLLRRPEVEWVESNGLVWASDDRPPRGAGTTSWMPREAATTSWVPRWAATTTWVPRSASHAPADAAGEPLFTRQAWHYDVIDAFHAWEVTTGSPNVIVAVVDDGIRFDHPDIAGNLRTDGYDFVSLQPLSSCTSGSFTTSMDGDGPDPDPTIPASLAYDSDSDCVIGLEETGGHGLHVAGTIGARAGNGEGGTGVAWEVSIRPVRALGSAGFGSFDDIAQAILYAAGLPVEDGAGGMVQAVPGADVINLSLGGSSPSATLESAVQAATLAGSLVIAAAGNAASSTPNYPAAYPDALSVSAIGPDLALASYSSFGSTVDIAAPGGEGANGADHAVWSLLWDFDAGAPTYVAFNGTSMATPHVSGVAALVLAASPGLTNAQLRDRLVDHAVDLGAAGPDDAFGAGLVDANASVRNGVGAPRDTYVWAYDGEQGTIHGPVQVGAGGGYVLGGLPDGEYSLFAGQDRNGDEVTGLFGRRWGALGGSTTPSPVVIVDSSIETASFDLGLPVESESNGTLGTADPLPLGGYAFGVIATDADVDLYRLDLVASTAVVVETDAVVGSCGLAGQVDTVVRVLDAAGVGQHVNDDVDTSLGRHCSRIETTLEPGTYYVEVTGWEGDTGPYAVRIGEGS